MTTANDVRDTFCYNTACGKAIAEDTYYCSDDCTDADTENQQRRWERKCQTCGKTARQTPIQTGEDKCVPCKGAENTCAEHGLEWCFAC